MSESFATIREIRRLPELLVELRAYEKLGFSKGKSYAIVGCGSSYHLGLIVSEVGKNLGYRIEAYTSGAALSRKRVYDKLKSVDTVLLVSRTGQTSETVRLAEMLKGVVRTVGISCASKSPLSEAVDHAFNFGFMAEESVVMTSSFSALLAFLLRGLEELEGQVDHILESPEKIARTLWQFEENVGKLDLQCKNHFVFLGYDHNFFVSKESALKVQELSLLTTEYNEPLEFRHGPVATLNSNTHVVIFGAESKLEDDLAKELREKGASVEVLTPSDEGIVHDLLTYPSYAQFLGYYLAVHRGLNPDKPKGLVKSVQLDI
ncbi:SIS domain-containing protein [Fervidobacterium thailandense]|uniref:SIS domain-containing protein n=1 Tax=Fervidobacterium thailandense TaxID=1008305 RepID=A0A1E3G137_9BACT|nr:SIS domain-containing protein [Fervidobacterium thailandense]ODN29947.1 hypothetical protein A4H02_08050 [Fervidobacterium thailandense]